MVTTHAYARARHCTEETLQNHSLLGEGVIVDDSGARRPAFTPFYNLHGKEGFFGSMI